jgi:type II secretory pathway pseudopilin PulG
MKKRAKRKCRGFTVVEVLFVTGLLGLVLSTLAMFLGSAQNSYRASAASMNLETRGMRLVRRIVDALRSADGPSVSALPSAPFSASLVNYQLVLPYDGSQTGFSPPTRIRFDAVDGTVHWEESPGLPEERHAPWGGGVTPFAEGEVFNGLDDNGNGLIDESGLFFSREGNLLTIGLTLSEIGPNGTPSIRSWDARLLLRN